MRLGDPDGHGRYGILTEVGGLLTCHECGRRVRSLGSHIRAHGLTAAEYRARHGLARGTALIVAELSAERSEKASARIGTPAWDRLVERRDPLAASASRDLEAMQPRAQTMATKVPALTARNKARKPRPRTCTICGAEWTEGGRANRPHCGRPECAAEIQRRAHAAMVATQAQARRAITDAEAAHLRTLTGGQLWTEAARLVADRVTQRQLVQVLGLSAATVSRGVNGRPDPRIALYISDTNPLTISVPEWYGMCMEEEPLLTNREILLLVDDLLEGLEAMEEGHEVRDTWPTEIRLWVEMILDRNFKPKGDA